MNVLLAVDGSEYSVKAVEFLSAHFDWFKNSPKLHVFHVKAPLSDGILRSLVGNAALDAYYKDESQAALAPAEDLLRAKGVAFESAYAIGEVGVQVQQYVKEHQVDLIVMGSHGFGVMKQVLMGSVATKVLATSAVPVLLVR